jgi:hypothetical protein
MNDDLLYTLQQTPDPAFARSLRERLHGDGVASSRRAFPVRPLAIAGAIVVVLGVLFSMPGVRAYADSFLAMFRVVNFVAVPVSSHNAIALTSQQLDLPRLLSEQMQVLQEPGPPLTVVSPAAASGSVGFTVAEPSYLPAGMVLSQTAISGPGAVRATIDAARLNDVLNALSISDLEIPAELNGQTVYLNTSPVVRLDYGYPDKAPPVSLLQSRPPQVQMPKSLDLPRLGEIALRILGMPADDAARLAQTIDWTSTFLVPVPPDAVSFQRIDIGGHAGIEIESPAPQRTVLLLWSTDDRVFALKGDGVQRDQLQQMADSIR